MMVKNAMEMLIEEVEELVKELNDADKIADFLEGKFIPKSRNKYVLYFRKPAEEIDFSFAYYYHTYKFLYAFISEKTPFIIRSKRNKESEVARLVPLDKQAYAVIKPDTKVTLRVVGWPKGEITFEVSSDGGIYDAHFDDEAVFNSFEQFPYPMYHKLVQVMKFLVSLGTTNAKNVYAKHIALEYLGNHEFVYETYAWYLDSLDGLRLLLLNTSLKGTTGNLVAAITDIPKLTLKVFNKLLESVERVEILKEVNEDGSGKNA